MLYQVRAARPDVVFNLVESLGGADSLVYLSHAVLDAAGIPYTGNRSESLFLTTHKLLAKERLRHADLPTPAWIEDTRAGQPSPRPLFQRARGASILKFSPKGRGGK